MSSSKGKALKPGGASKGSHLAKSPASNDVTKKTVKLPNAAASDTGAQRKGSATNARKTSLGVDAAAATRRKSTISSDTQPSKAGKTDSKATKAATRKTSSKNTSPAKSGETKGAQPQSLKPVDSKTISRRPSKDSASRLSENKPALRRMSRDTTSSLTTSRRNSLISTTSSSRHGSIVGSRSSSRRSSLALDNDASASRKTPPHSTGRSLSRAASDVEIKTKTLSPDDESNEKHAEHESETTNETAPTLTENADNKAERKEPEMSNSGKLKKETVPDKKTDIATMAIRENADVLGSKECLNSKSEDEIIHEVSDQGENLACNMNITDEDMNREKANEEDTSNETSAKYVSGKAIKEENVVEEENRDSLQVGGKLQTKVNKNDVSSMNMTENEHSINESDESNQNCKEKTLVSGNAAGVDNKPHQNISQPETCCSEGSSYHDGALEKTTESSDAITKNILSSETETKTLYLEQEEQKENTESQKSWTSGGDGTFSASWNNQNNPTSRDDNDVGHNSTVKNDTSSATKKGINDANLERTGKQENANKNGNDMFKSKSSKRGSKDNVQNKDLKNDDGENPQIARLDLGEENTDLTITCEKRSGSLTTPDLKDDDNPNIKETSSSQRPLSPVSLDNNGEAEGFQEKVSKSKKMKSEIKIKHEPKSNEKIKVTDKSSKPNPDTKKVSSQGNRETKVRKNSIDPNSKQGAANPRQRRASIDTRPGKKQGTGTGSSVKNRLSKGSLENLSEISKSEASLSKSVEILSSDDVLKEETSPKLDDPTLHIQGTQTLLTPDSKQNANTVPTNSSCTAKLGIPEGWGHMLQKKITPITGE
ncbi:uncharacterized protein DDB_G0287625-like [Lingula anatina]|uniref:Uncharacterized protein DDB_G0287625-like n=1 Tax=Lingula anatina TaxID=7574 RepID=A0A1S3H0T4_LINAN|nr:uncharacterized protein DDB_G0287625-like [Lingula anatina]|eukprot:XP_013379745.1 uncharacterized protein DDB_G0287625-like [Lingula anatina]